MEYISRIILYTRGESDYIFRLTIHNVRPLILCIDRDNDFGRKVGIKGPIIGFSDNMEAAQKLALTDPTDTDVNAIYGALKIASENDAQIVTITGDAHVGLVSDREVSRQLDQIMKKLSPNAVIFVSDGLDDEQVIPIIQSRVRIDAVHRVVVRQSKELEKAYFKLANFMKEVMADPELARLIFGLPGVILLLLALWGAQAASMIMGVIGSYLIVKGVGWEDELFKKFGEFMKSLSIERVSTFLYAISAITFALGLAFSWQDMQRSSIAFGDAEAALNTIGLFILGSSSLNILLLALGIAILARVADEWSLKNFIYVKQYMVLGGFIIVLKVFLESIARYVIADDYGVANFMLSGLIVLASLMLWAKIAEYVFKPEIDLINRLIETTEGKTIVDDRGNEIGKVRKAIIENLKVKEIYHKKRVYKGDDIISLSDPIVVKSG